MGAKHVIVVGRVFDEQPSSASYSLLLAIKRPLTYEACSQTHLDHVT